MKTAVLTLVASLALVGCQTRTGSVIVQLDTKGTSQLSPDDRVDIAISPAIQNRLEPDDADKVSPPRLVIQYDTGAIWRRVFIGQRDDKARFEISNTSLRHKAVAIGIAMKFTYEIEGVLYYGGSEYKIHCEGESSDFPAGSAQRQAVELGISDAARACKAIIKHKA